MSDILDLFVTEARAVDFKTACDRIRIPKPLQGKPEYQGPCPRCGGKDRFAVNRGKGVWNCRGCGEGGRDGIGLAAHVNHLDLRGRAAFLNACSIVLDQPVPKEGEQESESERAERLARIAAAESKADIDRQASEQQQNDFRQREIERARGLWLNAVDCRLDGDEATAGARMICSYVKARTGFDPAGTIFDHIRFLPRATYWHGQDAMGRVLALYTGPALIVPIVDVMTGKITGSQTIWLDLSVKPKRRPVLWGLTKAGREAGFDELDDGGAIRPPREDLLAAGYYERISSKKMRGHKKGGVIPVAGDPAATRWLGGEGIETTAAYAGREGFRDDTFYFAAGDIGNMAGPSDPASNFQHPLITKPDAGGRKRFVRVLGPVPKADSEDSAMCVAQHVTSLVLLVDPDSEPVATASAMARARCRFQTPEREVSLLYAARRKDWADFCRDEQQGQAG